MKLISMKDFVLNLFTITEIHSGSEALEKIQNYANFLNQPLTLGMFQGENKLFEGFKVISTQPKGILFNGWNILSERGLKNYTIEHLIEIRLTMKGEDVAIHLTQSALKQIGL